MSAFNQRLTRRIASQPHRIIVRSQAAADRLHSWGVTAPMVATANNAFNFCPAPIDTDFVQRIWPEAAAEAIGMAVVDFYRWPVVIRPWGRPENCYRWPYCFSCSPERRRASQGLITVLMSAGVIAWALIVANVDKPWSFQRLEKHTL